MFLLLLFCFVGQNNYNLFLVKHQLLICGPYKFGNFNSVKQNVNLLFTKQNKYSREGRYEPTNHPTTHPPNYPKHAIFPNIQFKVWRRRLLKHRVLTLTNPQKKCLRLWHIPFAGMVSKTLPNLQQQQK